MDNPAAVCVTGASGFIASHIVRVGLERGYRVHGTVRDAKSAESTAHLRSLPGAAERLRLFSAELLKQGSYDEAVAGCKVPRGLALAGGQGSWRPRESGDQASGGRHPQRATVLHQGS
ncbi:unnamed protein product [Polarella glacialis]|uniref:NAD-dependent epimerase/dehydratase domain-containing protein n=1 Tax=Polarella glacialis TaxID=89957 RepID=A0A813L321_POLGL|nr:unnamed protein product [Polarella glacialis]